MFLTKEEEKQERKRLRREVPGWACPEGGTRFREMSEMGRRVSNLALQSVHSQQFLDRQEFISFLKKWGVDANHWDYWLGRYRKLIKAYSP